MDTVYIDKNMGIFMKVITRMGRSMVMVCNVLQMGIFMMVILKMVIDKV
jgi:hypothetical protein